MVNRVIVLCNTQVVHQGGGGEIVQNSKKAPKNLFLVPAWIRVICIFCFNFFFGCWKRCILVHTPPPTPFLSHYFLKCFVQFFFVSVSIVEQQCGIDG